MMSPYKTEIFNDETQEYEEGIPETGDRVKEYFQTGKTMSGEIIGYVVERTYQPPTKEELETIWVNKELDLINSYINIPNFSNKDDYIKYRDDLMNWKNTNKFPNIRPKLILNK